MEGVGLVGQVRHGKLGRGWVRMVRFGRLGMAGVVRRGRVRMVGFGWLRQVWQGGSERGAAG